VVINGESLKADYSKSIQANGVPPTKADDIAARGIGGLSIDLVEHICSDRDKLGVFCLSETWKSMLLWAHYGNEHRGAVIEFDTARLDPEAIGRIASLEKVQYSPNRIDFIARGMKPLDTLLYKGEDWAYEKEWRLIYSVCYLDEPRPGLFLRSLKATAISGIIFGARSEGPEEEAAIDLIQQNQELAHVSVRKAVFNSHLMNLDCVSGHEYAGMIMHGQHHFGPNWREYRQWVDFESVRKATETLPPPVQTD